MASFLSTSEKESINSILVDLHDTFKQDVYVYTSNIPDVADDSDYNPLYGRSSDQSFSSDDYELIKETISARVHYMNEQKEVNDQLGGQMNLSVSQGIVRLKVDKVGIEKIKTAQKVEVDDVLYLPVSDPKVIGPFGNQFYMIYLRREN
jgi:hypothetical protein